MPDVHKVEWVRRYSSAYFVEEYVVKVRVKNQQNLRINERRVMLRTYYPVV